MSNPWSAHKGEDNLNSIGKSDVIYELQGGQEFEDNFSTLTATENKESEKPAVHHQPLEDSAIYLRNLERKLEKIKKNAKLTEALAEKREDCLRSLVDGRIEGISNNNNELIELDASIEDSFYRHIQPVRPITIGETVHIINYDQLEEQQRQQDEIEASEDIET